jgi:hypothetical protein
MAAEATEGLLTTQAWVMLSITWAVIVYFTSRFFLKVLTLPIRPEREAQLRDGILEKDA